MREDKRKTTEKELKHIEGLVNLLDDGQKLVVKRVGDHLEFTLEEDFI